MGPSTLAGVLAPRLVGTSESSDPNALRRALVSGSRERFPLTHLRERDPQTLPAREALERSIEDTALGRWSVFGTPVSIDASRHEWARHPTTGALPSRVHWTRLRYMDGIGGGDVKSIWELSRHHHLLRLAQGYFLHRDGVDREAQAEKLLVLLESWIAENPTGVGVNWTSSLEVAFRAIAWCWIWALTCESDAWTPIRVRRFLVSLWHHARHIERFDSIHHSPNTHLTGEGLGLLYVGLLFPELNRSTEWASRGKEILETELDAQVLGDGMHYERSVGYHKYTAEFYVHYLVLARAFGLAMPDVMENRIRAQLDVAALLRRPDGTWPVIGDEDSGDTLLLAPVHPQDQGPLLALGAGVFRDAEILALTTESHRSAGWWLLDESAWQWMRSLTTRTPSGTVKPPASGRIPGLGGAAGALPSAGYFLGREDDSDSAWWCLVDAGPHGGDATGHAHTDLGHTEIAHGATHIVVDPGCAGYTIGRKARDHARSEAAHACLVIDDAPLAVPSGSFSWSRLAPTPAHSWGDDGSAWWCELSYSREHAGGQLTHRRQVVLVRGVGVIVCDWIDGATSERLAVHWPLGDTPNDDDVSGNTMTTRSYAMAWSASGDGLDASLESTTRAPSYGSQVQAKVLRLAYRGGLPALIVTCFANPTTWFGRHLHDGHSVRVELPPDDTGQPRDLSIHAGMAPLLGRSHIPASSLPVTR